MNSVAAPRARAGSLGQAVGPAGAAASLNGLGVEPAGARAARASSSMRADVVDAACRGP